MLNELIVVKYSFKSIFLKIISSISLDEFSEMTNI